jgi:hypothetical protein
MIAQTLPDASILRQLAAVEPTACWHSSANIGWTIGGGDFQARGKVKQALGDLYKAGEIQRIFVTHNDAPLLCYFIDSAHLLALAEAAER